MFAMKIMLYTHYANGKQNLYLTGLLFRGTLNEGTRSRPFKTANNGDINLKYFHIPVYT